jgi:hypothetical protein
MAMLNATAVTMKIEKKMSWTKRPAMMKFAPVFRAARVPEAWYPPPGEMC